MKKKIYVYNRIALLEKLTQHCKSTIIQQILNIYICMYKSDICKFVSNSTKTSK